MLSAVVGGRSAEGAPARRAWRGRTWAACAFVLVAGSAVAGQDGRAASSAAAAAAPGWRVEDLAGAPLTAAGVLVDAPAARWVLSADLRLADGARAQILNGTLTLSRRGSRFVVRAGARRRVLARAAGAHHVQAVIVPARGGVAIDARVDGRVLPRLRRGARTRWTAVAAQADGVRGLALMTSALGDPVARLLHRLLDIAAQTPRGRQPIGQGRDGRLRFAEGWTTGFYASALWQAYDLTAAPLFRRLATTATADNFGAETSDTHDLGFMYERSSVAAWRRLCVPEPRDAICPAARASGLQAADALARLASTNAAVGLIPTRSRSLCRGCRSLREADTIIDSLVNLPLLFWAADSGGRTPYRAIAERHALQAARLLVRRDGSTWQSIHVDRADGSLIRRHTHQGKQVGSTWSRGQAWAVYGFAAAADALRSHELLATAERVAGYVARHVPRDGVPRWDYDGPRDDPRDVSASAITAAGLVRLDRACRALGTCRSAGAWVTLARRMLDGTLRHASRGPQVGLLGRQVYSLGGRSRWDDDAELIWGLDYALEAARALRPPVR